MPRRSRDRRFGTAAIEGLEVRIIDDPTPSGAELGQALRLLARLMVRNHGHARDHEAITNAQSGLTLTVSPTSRPDHVDDAA